MNDISWKQLSGLRQPTESEYKAIKFLFEEEHRYDRTAALIAMAMFAMFTAIIAIVDAQKEITNIMFIIIVISSVIMIVLQLKKSIGYNNIKRGQFTVADIFCDDFVISVDSEVGAFTYVTDTTGKQCYNPIPININIARRYQGQVSVPMIYMYEKVTRTKWVYAPEEIDGALAKLKSKSAK